MWHFVLAVVVTSFALKATTEHEYYKQGRIGEYYEYDVEGSQRRSALHKMGYQVKISLKRPAKFMWNSGKQSCRAIRVAKNMLEQYLRGATKNEEEQQKLSKALTDWESIMTNMPSLNNSKSPQGLLYVPYESWRLFKYSLYLVGFALPRGLKKGAKNIIVNTFAGI